MTVYSKEKQVAPLTAREKQILDLLASGLLYKEIAYQNGISMDTVKKHCKIKWKPLIVGT
jgi:DNA-binding CsgD family transcriptional regulator